MTLMMLLTVLIIGFIYYPSIEASIVLLRTKTLKEFEELLESSKESIVSNKFLLVTLILIRLPLLIVVVPILIIHIYKLAKESK